MAGFADLAARLDEIAKVPSRIAAPVAEEINASLQEQFETGVNAYGNAWKPLLPQTVRRKKGDTRILRRTDTLSAETYARPMAGAGIEIVSRTPGDFHQNGTKHMVPRKILPDGATLPKKWQEAIAKAFNEEFEKATK